MSNDYERVEGEREIYRGRQWVVTSFSITALKPKRYWFAASRLREGLCKNGQGWAQHVAGKRWVDLEDFIDCYLVACVVFGVKSKYIGEEIRQARAKRARDDLYDQISHELFPIPPGSYPKLLSMAEIDRRDNAIEAELARRAAQKQVETEGDETV